MGVEVVTKEDLYAFESRLLVKIERLIKESFSGKAEPEKGIKTKDARRMLGCCANTLAALRVQGKLRVKKIGGMNYYHPDDISKLIREGFR